ncbi:MAG: hypothetical protein AAGH19_08015 [Pseudomonadota bacterium]
MSTQLRKATRKRAGGAFAAGVLLCAISQSGWAQTDPSAPVSTLPDSPFTLVDAERSLTGPEGNNALTVQLSGPFSLEAFGEQVLGQTSEGRLTGSTLNYQLDDRLSLQGGMSLSGSQGNFLSLGSIQCQNGILDAMSYRASDCTFIDDQPGERARSIALGAAYELGSNARASVSLFQQSSTSSATYQPGLDAAAAAAMLNPFARSFGLGDALPGAFDPLLPGAGITERERTGVDVEFQVGFSTDQAGDLILGLQLTRVLDSGTEGVFYATPGVRNWTIAQPYDAAKLSFDWNRGRFSGGIDSYYRSPVEILGAGPLDSQATFDVHFSWRAPWNASLSVGASNVMGAGSEDNAAADPSMVDPLESIYGRIPYVRYKQDL